MNLLILGSGSIGTRHLNNCIAINPQANIIVLSRTKKKWDEFPKVKCIQNLDELTFIPDAAIIATPTANHISDCFALIELGIPLIYLEKPVSHNLEHTTELLSLANRNGTMVFVGYDLRFDPGLGKVKSLIESKCLGELQAVFSEVGQYLPDWRKGTDHREGMSAKIELGGGVMLDLIHEFDYVNWLIGPFEKVYGFHKMTASLEIETEAVAVTSFKSKSGVIGTITQDYLQKELSRKAKFIFDFGSIEWNYVSSEVKWKSSSETEWQFFNYNHFERNDRFIDAMSAFLNAKPKDYDNRLTLLNDGIHSLQAVVSAKNSTNLL